MSKLTKRTIDALPIKDTDYIIWDSELRGFGIRVWPSCEKARERFLSKEEFIRLSEVLDEV